MNIFPPYLNAQIINVRACMRPRYRTEIGINMIYISLFTRRPNFTKPSLHKKQNIQLAKKK